MRYLLLLVFVLILPIGLISNGITFIEAIAKLEGKDKSSTSEFLNLLVNIASRTKFNSQAEEFHEYLSKSLEKFEFKDLYNSKYMKSSNDGYKRVNYGGLNSKEGLFVNLIETEFEKIPIQNFGDFASSLSLKKNSLSSVTKGSYAKSNSYSGDLKLDQNFGIFSHNKGANLLNSLLSVIDINNLEKTNYPPTKTFKNLKNTENRKLLELIANDLPSVSRFLNQFFEADSILKESKTNDKRPTLFVLNGRINNRHVQNQYPYLAGYFDDISDLGWIHTVLTDSLGNKIFEINLESESLLLYVKFYTLEGKIIPYKTQDGIDTLDLSKAFSIPNLTSYNFKMDISFEGRIYGLKLKTNHILIQGLFTNRAEEGSLYFILNEFPKTSVSGGFSYIIPSWAIDLAIPGNMEELIEHFTSVLLHANQEKGSFVKLNWKKKANWIFSIRSESEFVDNFFIRFGLKVFNYKIKPNQKAGEELSQFLVQILELTKQDLNAKL